MKFSRDVRNITLEGTVSQRLYLGLSFLFYLKKREAFIVFFFLILDFIEQNPSVCMHQYIYDLALVCYVFLFIEIQISFLKCKNVSHVMTSQRELLRIKKWGVC